MWDEEDVSPVVASTVARSILSISENDLEYLTVSLVEEVIEWGEDIPETVDDARKRLDRAGLVDAMVGYGVEEDEVCELVKRLPGTLRDALFEEEEDEGDDLLPGECELCERTVAITRHHVHPKKVHDWCVKHLKLTRKACHHTIGICRPCHNAVHGFADHKTLAEHYDTVSLLLDAPEIFKFVSWAKKQKVKIPL
eukprot:TRINITY_DN339_c0_g1_i1.p1 TRINITY_DN339_c0_g1~~TRINITY_DN339_c0_g1_i1.p1  ORF type:complete len:196 (+),score=31.47 TRINITY_DN339_c0_g1_i1:232-819(+)